MDELGTPRGSEERLDERYGAGRSRALDRSVVLISFANVAAQPLRSCLLRFDVVAQRGEWVDVGLGQLLASGVGICADDQHVYHVCVANPDFSTYLVVLDRATLDVKHVQPLPQIDDGHSVVRYGDELMVVSTGTDQIFAYPLCGMEVGGPRVAWSPSASGTDTHHVNSLTIADGDLLCSAFGPREDDSWYTARNGYIWNISTGDIVVDGLRQPHSATWYDGRLFFCNSLEGTVNTLDGEIVFLYGYSRGLAFGPDSTLYAGTSLSRRPPSAMADAGLFGNPSDDGDLHGQCALIEMSQSGANRVEVAMSQFGNEIYDILVL